MTNGIVFDIQRFSMNDGNGIRTLVFLKGCPLRCEWCANPESQRFTPQVGFFKDKCVGCMKCSNVCSSGQVFRETGRVEWEKCSGCLQCIDSCLYEARVLFGKQMSVDEVMDVVVRDRVFYEKSNGGVTIGGGEPTAQPEFAREILKRCRETGIHTAMETCGYSSWEVFEKVINHVDLLLFDFKNMDSMDHMTKTGVGNERILDNAVRASHVVKEMVVRFPLIPGFNDSDKNANELGLFVRNQMPLVNRIDILKYHSIGESKHLRIGKEYKFHHKNELSEEKVANIKKILESYGMHVTIGG